MCTDKIPIEITPAMIEAGERRFDFLVGIASPDSLVAEVYLAMETARNRSLCAPSNKFEGSGDVE